MNSEIVGIWLDQVMIVIHPLIRHQRTGLHFSALSVVRKNVYKWYAFFVSTLWGCPVLIKKKEKRTIFLWKTASIVCIFFLWTLCYLCFSWSLKASGVKGLFSPISPFCRCNKILFFFHLMFLLPYLFIFLFFFTFTSYTLSSLTPSPHMHLFFPSFSLSS